MKAILEFVGLLWCATVAFAGESQRGIDPAGAHVAGLKGTTVSLQDGGIAGSGPSWSSLGPFGGDVYDVAASPSDANIVLAGIAPAGGTGGGLFRSTDGGANWTSVAQLDGNSVYDIEFTPAGVAYIATVDSVWKSIDAGASWTQLNLNIGLNDQVFDVAISPANPNVLWIGVADALGSQPINVMRSMNGGANWTNQTPPLGGAMSCRAIAINPNNPQHIYAGFGGAFGGGQLWVTADGGHNWVNRSAGLPNTPVNDVVHDGTRALVCGGQLFGSQTFGLFQTTDLGESWTPLHDESWPSLVLNDIAISLAANNTLYVVSATAGAFRSIDGGAVWEFGVGGTASASLNSVRFSPANSSVLYLGGNSVGVLKSTDSGGNFNISSNGIGKLNVVWIDANPVNPSELAIAFQGQNDGGVYASTNGGQTWTLQSVPPTRYSNVTFAPDGTLYAISSGPSSIAPEGVYRRNPDESWTSLGPDQGTLFESDLASLRFSQSDPKLILAGGADFGVAGFEATVWLSTDSGSKWTKTYEGFEPSEFVTDFRIISGSSDQVILASFVDNSGSSGGGALRSTDGGVSWSPSSAGLPELVQAKALAASPSAPDTFYLADRQFGASGGLYRTIDGGQSWTSTGFVGQVWDIVSNPNNDQVLYLLQPSATPVQISNDAGATFSPFITGLSFNGFVNDLAYAGGPAPRLLLSTSAGSFATDLTDLNPADLTGNGVVDVDDLLVLINSWGPCDDPCPPCPADIEPLGGNCVVDVDDLLLVINSWS